MGQIYADRELVMSNSVDEHPRQSDYTLHFHDTAELLYFISGNCVYHIEGSSYTAEPGDIFITRPMEAHYVELSEDVKYERIVLNFSTDIFKSLDPEGKLTKALFERKSGKQNLYRGEDNVAFFDENIRNMSKQNDRVGILAYLMPVLWRIFAIYDKLDGSDAALYDETRSAKIIRYINHNIGEKLLLEKICEMFFVSKSQLCREFKKATGTTVGDYIMKKRLMLIRKDILAGALPTKAYQNYGFADYSAFYRAFVKRFGVSPKEIARGKAAKEEVQPWQY